MIDLDTVVRRCLQALVSHVAMRPHMGATFDKIADNIKRELEAAYKAGLKDGACNNSIDYGRCDD